jgi:hypothetical protein
MNLTALPSGNKIESACDAFLTCERQLQYDLDE